MRVNHGNELCSIDMDPKCCLQWLLIYLASYLCCWLLIDDARRAEGNVLSLLLSSEQSRDLGNGCVKAEQYLLLIVAHVGFILAKLACLLSLAAGSRLVKARDADE
jgi:hypothetical protein